jgi:hypothetical protein
MAQNSPGSVSEHSMKPRVFRSTPAFVLGWVWMVFAAANLVDVAIWGRAMDSAIAAGALLFGCGIAYMIGLRPRVVADEESVRLHNPLRDVRVPWSAVDKIETTDAIVIHCDNRPYRAYAPQTSPRARARAEARARRGKSTVPDHVAEYVKGRLPVDFAADQLNELAQTHRDRRADGAGAASAASPSVSLCWPAITAVVIPGILLTAAVLAAVLT